jgi:integrase
MVEDFTPPEKMTIMGFLRTLIELLDGSLASSTILLYEQSIRKLTEIIGDMPLEKMTPYHVELFKAKRLQEVSATKVSIDFRTLRAAFGRAVKFKMIETNPFAACANIRVLEKPPCFLSKHEFQRLLGVVDDPQMFSLIVLAVCTSMRLGELVNLLWENIDFTNGVVHFTNRDDFELKGRRNRSIPLNQRASSVLQKMPRSSDFVFSGKDGGRFSGRHVSRRFKLYARKA